MFLLGFYVCQISMNVPQEWPAASTNARILQGLINVAVSQALISKRTADAVLVRDANLCDKRLIPIAWKQLHRNTKYQIDNYILVEFINLSNLRYHFICRRNNPSFTNLNWLWLISRYHFFQIIMSAKKMKFSAKENV